MAIGDGSGWDETTPTDATTAIQIDDYNRDLRVGVSARMRHEHEWPDSQSATSEGGKHKWVTMQALTAKPTLAGTQISGIYCKTDNLFFEKSAGTEVQIVVGTAVGDGKVLISATDTAAGYLIDAFDTSMIRLVSTTAGSEAIGLRTYDSGWFAVTGNNVYAKTHNLGTTAVLWAIYASDSATGATNVFYMDGAWASYDNMQHHGTYLKDMTTTTVNVYLATYFAAVPGIHVSGGAAGWTTGGIRIVGLALG